MNEFKTPREITIVLHSRDGWTIPQIAEISMMPRDTLAVQLERWEDISGMVAAETVKAARKMKPPDKVTSMSISELARICEVHHNTVYYWATAGKARLAGRDKILLSCADVGDILRRRDRAVKDFNAVEAWFRSRGLPADCGD